MYGVDTNVADWLQLVRGEFQEIPGLYLTKPQVQRLWGLDPVTCDALLDTLVNTQFLKRTSDGQYARLDAGC